MTCDARAFRRHAQALVECELSRVRGRLAKLSPDERTAVAQMVLRSYEMQQGAWEAGAQEEEVLGVPVSDRLGEIRCPTLVLIGDEDVADMRAIAIHVADSIDSARLVTVRNAAHLPSLERAEEANALLLDFLSN